MFFNAKRVLVIVAIIVGILTTVIFCFLLAGGLIVIDERDDLYKGVLNEKYRNASAGEPLDEDTLEALNDSDQTDGTQSADGVLRVLLFLRSGELAASGFVASESNEFSLVKSITLENVSSPGDLPHMNRQRDMLSYREVDAVIDRGGYFRVESGGRYVSPPADID